MSASPVLELCFCTPKPGVTDSDFAAALRAADAYLAGCAGFDLRRTLHASEPAQWIDLVYWRSIETAQAALAGSEKAEAMAPLGAALGDVSMGLYRRIDELSVGNAAVHDDLQRYEILTYRLKPTASPVAYRGLLARYGEEAAGLDGFLGREVYLDETEGTWVEILRFKDSEAMERLAPIVMALPVVSEMLAAIDESSVVLRVGSAV
ncbi:hypothetical protein [Paenibacillus sp.]|uniref:hypothetical protein n=1 Tax=Paenibacillus sp. TaxID=58172 RepID=UPI002D438416|nr:hypothetical protein [Paenibacillus sp.]HZG56221.1 hypothetical protein [Paenibacillus sp.]